MGVLKLEANAREAIWERLALSWLEGEQQAVIIVDRDLSILWASEQAERQLARRRDLERRGNGLAATDPSRQADLLRLIGDCGGETLATLCLPAEDGDGHVLFRARELARHYGPRCFGIRFHRSGSEFSVRYVDLDVAFNLTRSEHRVLLELAEGRSADEAARRLGVATETARSHIRQIYAKLNVSSREELFSRIRPYRA